MTLAGAALSPNQPTVSQAVPIVILGTDALLAAAPATPVQLAHACLRAGFANVVPASWGDEIIAASVMRHLPQFGDGPVIQCSCPIVAHRLLMVGADLRPVLLPLVSPPVALARYLRAVSQPAQVRVTYVGGCPGAADVSIDVRMTPVALIDMLAERHILLDEQPRVFEAIIPPDRRRFRSQPGGLPAADVLWNELGARSILEIDTDDFVVDVAQQVLAGKNVLIDVSARLGCVCAGAGHGTPPRDARASVVALEPPRATTPVVEEQVSIELDLPVPSASRSPLDVVAVTPSVTPPGTPLVMPPGALSVALREPLREAPRDTARDTPASASPAIVPSTPFSPVRAGDVSLGHRISPVHGFSAVADLRAPRTLSPLTPRPVLTAAPQAKEAAKKKLPRAYVARRRSSPKGNASVSATPEAPTEPTVTSAPRDPLHEAPSRSPISAPNRSPMPAPSPALEAPRPTPWRLGKRQLVYLAIAVVMVVIAVGTVIGVIVGRSLSR